MAIITEEPILSRLDRLDNMVSLTRCKKNRSLSSFLRNKTVFFSLFFKR